jgi:hypothetical protein
MGDRMLSLALTALLLATLACGLGGGEPGRDEARGGGRSPADWPWDDVPMYDGADLESVKEWEDLSVTLRFEKVEGRYLETPDRVGDVLDYYKEQMPQQGWTGGEDAEAVNDFSSVHWRKAGAERVATITISTDPDGNVRVMIVRADQPKD